MNTINKADIISWLRKKTTTNVLLVLMITSDGMSSAVFRRTPAGDFTPVEGGAAHEKTSALKTVFEIVSSRFQGNARQPSLRRFPEGQQRCAASGLYDF